MEMVGIFRDPRERRRIAPPRDSWRCKSCGWTNVFVPASGSAGWRARIETKATLDSGVPTS